MKDDEADHVLLDLIVNGLVDAWVAEDGQLLFGLSELGARVADLRSQN